jgi:cell division protein FtsL
MKRLLLYAMAITIPLSLALLVGQGARYASLKDEVHHLYKTQEALIERNNNAIADILRLSSPERVERLAKTTLGLEKKRPEDVTQIIIKDDNGSTSTTNEEEL